MTLMNTMKCWLKQKRSVSPFDSCTESTSRAMKQVIGKISIWLLDTVFKTSMIIFFYYVISALVGPFKS